MPTAREALRLERAVVVFPFEGSAVGPQVAERLRELLPLMRLAKRIQVLGYTDDQGPQAANDKVAQARALAVMVQVRQILGDDAPQALSAKGQGLCCYISHNQSEAGRALNRRVEVLLSSFFMKAFAVVFCRAYHAMKIFHSFAPSCSRTSVR